MPFSVATLRRHDLGLANMAEAGVCGDEGKVEASRQLDVEGVSEAEGGSPRPCSFD